jgi:NAD(P)H-flavin reductase
VLLREAVQTTPRTRLLRLDLQDGPFGFRAGQAVMAGLTGSHARSAYSIASSPALAARGTLELLVPAEGAFGEPGFDPVSGIGLSLTLEGPLGSFGVPGEAEGSPLLLVAGGTGIAPLRSVILDRLDHPHAPPIALVYSARTPDEFAFEDELEALARRGRLRLHKTVTRDEPAPGWPGRSGRIDQALLLSVLPNPDAWCLVCGPAGFVAAAATTLEGIGVPPAKIVVER